MVSVSLVSLLLGGLAASCVCAEPQFPNTRPRSRRLSRGFASTPSASAEVPEEFEWSTLKPTTNLKNMTDCFDGFQCGRLLVPLDHKNKNGAKATIAVQVYPATERDPSKYKGIIMFNPGGPGGSGTESISDFGSDIAKLVGPGYDLVGFDPRGTGQSLPLARCFSVEEWTEFSPNEVPSFDRRQDVALYLARSEIVARKCLEELGGKGKNKGKGPGYFFDSGSVVNDMVEIMKALGQKKMNYLGISYGTALGQYLVAMHPDKVDLVMIDSVLDGDAWRDGKLVETYQDTDEIIDAFYTLCARAGPSICPMAEKTKKLTKARVERIIGDLDNDPLVIMPHVDDAFVLTTSSFQSVVLGQMYSPASDFPWLAQTLLDVERRNVKALFEFGAKDRSGGQEDQAYQSIMCSDLPDLRNTTLSQAVALTKTAERTAARFVDDDVVRDQLMCVPWKMRPKNAFLGNFKPAKWAGKMLIISNMYDPVTPLAHARSVQKRIGDGTASLLIQNGLGHSPLVKQGNCVDGSVARFFRTRALPKNGHVCQPDELPFVGKVDHGIAP